MYKLIKEDELGKVHTMICSRHDATEEDLLKSFKFFLMANGFEISPTEEVVIYDFESYTNTIGTWPDEEKDGQ